MIQNKTATVFGGSGFLGRTVVQALAARGYIVRIPTRHLEKVKDLKCMGFPGQIVPLKTTLRADAAIAEAIKGSEIVINLIGILSEKGRDTFQTLHVETAARIARVARASGVEHFVHVSALGADPNASSRYARTKALGEEAVRAFCPDAIILRPGLLFGPRDHFLARFSPLVRFLPALPLIGGGRTRFQPVYVGDVVAALLACLDRKETRGRLFVLGGPQIYTLQELWLFLLETLGISRPLFPLSWGLAKMIAFFFEFMPSPLLTRQQVELLKTDAVVGTRRQGFICPPPAGFCTFEDLSLIPISLETVFHEKRASRRFQAAVKERSS